MTGPRPDAKTILDFVFEMGQLKRIPRSGWFHAGVAHPESVADHNLRAAQLAYLLAEMEAHPDPARVCAMVVFHEIGEARVGDVDKVGARYIEKAEARAARDQLDELAAVGEDLYQLWEECEEQTTEAGIIAKDADLLEAAITAKEYLETGHPAAQRWIDNTRPRLTTASARRLIDLLDEASFTDWWADLKEP